MSIRSFLGRQVVDVMFIALDAWTKISYRVFGPAKEPSAPVPLPDFIDTRDDFMPKRTVYLRVPKRSDRRRIKDALFLVPGIDVENWMSADMELRVTDAALTSVFGVSDLGKGAYVFSPVPRVPASVDNDAVKFIHIRSTNGARIEGVTIR